MTRLDIMRRSLAEAEKLSVDSKEVFTEGWIGLDRIQSWQRARLTDLERRERELLESLPPAHQSTER